MRAEDNPLELTALEIASNVVTGTARPVRRLPSPVPGLTPRAALEQSIVESLARPPCGVSFSGGRDSSAALATAVAVARREGLALPIPFTLRFPGVAEADEASWQEGVVRHLGLGDWERIEIGDELDLLGPVAQHALRTHGLLWPANTYVHAPMLERVAGGSLVTGVDGDGLLAGWRWQYQAEFVARRRRGRPREVLRVAHALSPAPVRRLVARTKPSPSLEWLRPPAARAVARAERRHVSREPFGWPRWVRWYDGRRHLDLLEKSYAAAAARHGVAVRHFFREPRFLAQFAAQSRFGPGERTAAMTDLFGDLLPKNLLERATKASFARPYWGPVTRAFVEEWDGAGVDSTVVDAGALSRVWRDQPNRDPGLQTALLLQAVWLDRAGDGG